MPKDREGRDYKHFDNVENVLGSHSVREDHLFTGPPDHQSRESEL